MNLKLKISLSIFSLFCLEDRNIKHVKAFVKDGEVHNNKEICVKKIVRMAYNQYDGVFELDAEGKVVKNKWISTEVLTSFFSSQNLTPVWENANFNWGSFDEETGRWTGAVGLVSHGSLHLLR